MDVEKQIEFLLEQEAKFWASLETTRQERREGFAEIKDILRGVVTVQGTLVQSQLRQDGRLGQLTEAYGHLGEASRQMLEAQRRADERMDALITVVNGLVRRARLDPPATEQQ